MARSCGYPYAVCVENFGELDRELQTVKERDGLCLIEVKCAVGSRKDLGRPTVEAVENRRNFMGYLEGVE